MLVASFIIHFYTHMNCSFFLPPLLVLTLPQFSTRLTSQKSLLTSAAPLLISYPKQLPLFMFVTNITHLISAWCSDFYAYASFHHNSLDDTEPEVKKYWWELVDWCAQVLKITRYCIV